MTRSVVSVTTRRPKIVVDAGSYSLSEASIAGVGLRVAEMAETLSRRFAVRVIAPAATDPVNLGDAEHLIPGDRAAEAIAAADVVMFFDTPDRHRIELAVAHRAAIIAECRAPVEHMSYPSLLASSDPQGEHQRVLGPYRRLLEVSHHFICRSQAERAALISALCTVGRIMPEDVAKSPTLDHLITTIPVGYGQRGLKLADSDEPIHLADFLWTGGIWTFFQPLMFVEAMAILRDRGVDTTAAFLHARPTDDTRPAIREITLAIDRFNLAGHVVLYSEPLDQRLRDRYVKAALAYVCIARPGVENETGTRLRLRDTALHGIPTVIDPWGLTSDVVAHENLGIVLNRPNPESLAEVLQQVKSGSVQRTNRCIDRFYDNSMAPLINWINWSCARSLKPQDRRSVDHGI